MIGCKHCGYEDRRHLWIRVRSEYDLSRWDFRLYAEWNERYQKYRISPRWEIHGPLRPTIWCGISDHRNPIPQKLWYRDRIWIVPSDVARMMNLL